MRVEPRRWDPAKTAAADQLDRFEPGWTIFYGVGSRRFHAIATWNAVQALHVQAATAEGLRERMRQAELEAMTARGLGGWVAGAALKSGDDRRLPFREDPAAPGRAPTTPQAENEEGLPWPSR